MMKYSNLKKVSFFILIFLIIATIPSVFASDVNGDGINNFNYSNDILDDAIVTSEDSLSDELSNKYNSNSILKNNLNLSPDAGKIITNCSNTTYNDLKSALDDNDGEDSFSVFIGEGVYSSSQSGDYTLSDGETNTNIQISGKNIVFIGSGADKTFIDGKHTDWLFNLYDSKISFINMSFINAYGNSASIINSNYTNLTIDGCNFVNNSVNGSAYSHYSPIYFYPGSGYYPVYTLNISNSNFENNSFYSSLMCNGGVLAIAGGKSSITNSTFVNNSALNMGGAVYYYYNSVKSVVDNCTFIDNSAKNGGSIASYWGGNLTVINSNFINSSAQDNGASIYVDDSSRVVFEIGNNTFDGCMLNNNVVTLFEDNVYINGPQVATIEDNAIIDVNDTTIIYGQDKNLTIIVKDKSNNIISNEELDIILISSKNNLTFKVLVTNGVAYLNLNNIPIGLYNATFNLNSSNYKASKKAKIGISSGYTYSLILDQNNVSITEGQSCVINGTVVDEYYDISYELDSVAVWINWTVLTDSLTESIKVLSGGRVIEDGKVSFDLANCELWSRDQPYTVNFDIRFEYDYNPFVSIDNGVCTVYVVEILPDNYSDIDVIYVDSINGHDGTGDGTELNPIKSLQVALNMNHVLGGNKVIILKEGNYAMDKYTIRDDVTVIGEDPSKVVISQFSGNRGMFEIENGITVKFDNVSFTNGYNVIIPYGSIFSNYYDSTLIVNNSIFYNNSGWFGGIINNNGLGNVFIENSLFYNNTARDGGIIYASGGNLKIFNSSFINNSAESNGVLALCGSVRSSIENSSFISNSAFEEEILAGGGAIGVSGNSVTDVKYCTFISNYVAQKGGAIWAYSANINIFGSVFINNTALEGGSVISADIYDNVANISNSVIISGDAYPILSVPAESGAVIIADNNWWGSNTAPNVFNVGISSRIIMTLTNDEEGNVVVGLNTLSNGSSFDGYLPIRNVSLTPASNFENPIYGINKELVLSYAGNISSDRITATIDKQELVLNYQNFPQINSTISVEGIVSLSNTTISINASVMAGNVKLNTGTVSFYIDDVFIGNASVNDGVAILSYTPYVCGSFIINVVYSGDENYKPCNNSANLFVYELIPTKFIVNNASINVGDNFVVKLVDDKGNGIANQTVSLNITSNGVTNSKDFVTDDNGLLDLNLSAGNYEISGNYVGDSVYSNSNFKATVVVSKFNTTLSISQDYDDIIIKLINGSDLASIIQNEVLSGKEIVVDIKDVKGQSLQYAGVTDSKGTFTIRLNKGDYFVLAKFNGDDLFANTNASKRVSIIDMGIVFINHTGNGDALDIQAAIDAANPGAIIYLGSYDYVDVADVNITKNITLLGVGGTTITSAGDGTPVFNILLSSDGVEKVNITGITFNVNNKDVIALATAENGSGPLSIVVPEININNNTVVKVNEDVVAESVTVLKLDSERGSLAPANSIVVEDNLLVDGVKPFEFNVVSVVNGSDVDVPIGGGFSSKVGSVIEYQNMTTEAVATVDGRVGKMFRVVLKDANGNLLTNKAIQIGFNGKVYDRVTDDNGAAELQINLAVAGGYTFAICFLGDDEYNASFAVARITVVPQNLKVAVPNKVYKAYAKTKTLTATVLSNKGGKIAGIVVTFKVNGKTYTAKTDAKGVAKVNVSLTAKKTYSFTVSYAGGNKYAKFTKTAKITIN